MKKLVLSCAALVMLGYGTARAQAWSQDFNSGIPANWVMINADGKTPTSNWVPAIVSGLTTKAWMSWIRDTNDSCAITTSWFDPAGKADRWLITPSFQVTDPNMVLTWEDYATDASFADSIQILVSPTAGTTQADFTATLYNQSATPGSFGKHGVSLGAYNGQTIRIAMRDNSTDKAILMVDNVAAATLPATDIAVNDIDFMSLATGGSVPMLGANGSTVRVAIQNAGAQPITSVTLTYKIDGGTAVSQNFTGLNLPILGGAVVTFTTALTGVATGNHTLQVDAVDVNGAADAVASNNTVSEPFILATAVETRNCLMEEFTSSTCVPCAGFNATFDPFIETQNVNKTASNFNIIKYQMNWPAPGNDASYNPHGADRQTYYGVNSIPDHFSNGVQGGNGDLAEVSACKAPNSFMKISGTYTIKGDSVIADVTVTPDFTATSSSLKLHMAATEKEYTNPAATTTQSKYIHVMRAMLPSASGTTLASPASGVGQHFRFAMKYTVGGVAQGNFNFWGSPFAGNLVVFVQDDMNKEVMQSVVIPAQWPLSVGEVSGVNNVLVYPNPAHDYATVAFTTAKSEEVSISVIDVMGRTVYSVPAQKIAAGAQQVNIATDNLATGTYNVKIQTQSGSRTERLNVAK